MTDIQLALDEVPAGFAQPVATPDVNGQAARYEMDRVRYAERQAAHEAGLAKVQTWEWERMVLPRGTTRRARQTVTVQYNPDGWGRRGPGGGHTQICDTVTRYDGYPHPPGKTGHEQWNEDHGRHEVPPYGDTEFSVPLVWKVSTSGKARPLTTPSGGTWCDRCLPAEFRPQADGSPPPEFGPLAGQEPRKKREPQEELAAPRYFATVDHYDACGLPSKVGLWYESPIGRHKGEIRPWPPKRSDFGHLFTRDVPDEKTCRDVYGCSVREWRDLFWQDVKAVRAAALEQIRQDPWLCGARFARLHASCCHCGRAMWDEHSVAYGIGPECRRGASPEALQRLAGLTARERAAAAAGGEAPAGSALAAVLPAGDDNSTLADEDEDGFEDGMWTASDFGCMECGGDLGPPDEDDSSVCECIACGEEHLINDVEWDGERYRPVAGGAS